MATELTQVAANRTQRPIQDPQLVLEIDGVATRYGLGSIKKYIRIGDPGLTVGGNVDGKPWAIGGLSNQENQLDVITLDGTTSTIAQQLLQDKGGSTSVSSIQVALVDLNEEITRLITPNEIVDDILGRRANVYLGYQNTAFPQDFIQIFQGIIDDVAGGPTTVILNISSPEQKKRGEILQQVTTDLTATAKFENRTIQGVTYQARRRNVANVNIEYIGGGTAGSEVVTVAATNITVQIQAGVSTASQVREAIDKTLESYLLVETELVEGQESLVQSVTGSLLPLLIDTTINVVSTQGFLLPADGDTFKTYIRINDEVIEYTGLTPTSFTGCTREALALQDPRAFGETHKAGDSVQSFYRLQGSAIDLALKILLSGGPQYFAENVSVKSIGTVEGLGVLLNSIFFEGVFIDDKYGVVVGDKVTTVGDSIPANNVTLATISEIGRTDSGSYLVLSGVSLVLNVGSSATISFNSKYNVLPAGAGLEMGGDMIDVPQFEYILTTFAGSIFDYDYYVKETLNAKDFIDNKLLFPTGGFSLPRKGKISMGYTSPPLSVIELKRFNFENVARPDQQRIYRGITKYFYNNIAFKYNGAVTDDRYFSGNIELSADSKNRIKTSTKTLLIEAEGIRPSAKTDEIIDRLTSRFLDRYKFAAERIKIQAFYGDAFNRDVGDIVAFGGEGFSLPNTKKGTRVFPERLFEIVNRSLDIKTGVVTLDLVDTAYSIDGARFGVVSPASKTDTGSTTTKLILKPSYATQPTASERSKWTSFIGERIIVHADDWSFSYTTTILSFDPANPSAINVNPALPVAVSADTVIEIPAYPNTALDTDDAVYKRNFVFVNPVVAVTSGVDNLSFNVSLSDAALFLVDQTLIVYLETAEGEITQASVEAKVESIAGTLITVDRDLGFTPSNVHTVHLIGYIDGGFPYRFL
jgi:hypothetical protein